MSRNRQWSPGRLRTSGPGPLLSVVVPAYDVEAYLTECLDSILEQSYPWLEVVVVDDGSTDATGQVADLVAERDPRVRVVHQENAGLGAARNAGVARASGDYLAFADSDDLVAPDGYAKLVSSLERSGSDLAIGRVERDRDEAAYLMPLMRENHRTRLTSVRIDDAPMMLADCFAWNKVFRRSFWDRTGLEFPAGVRYEDQPTLTRALVEADRFDSLPDPVYRWRVRADGSSISQQRADLDDLADRIRTKRWATECVRERTCLFTQGQWFSRVLPIDMWEYFRSVPGCSDEYWDLLCAGMEEFWRADTVPFELTRIPLRQRLMGWMVQQGRRDELLELLDLLDRNGGRLPRGAGAGRDGDEHPFTGLPGLPAVLATA